MDHCECRRPKQRGVYGMHDGQEKRSYHSFYNQAVIHHLYPERPGYLDTNYSLWPPLLIILNRLLGIVFWNWYFGVCSFMYVYDLLFGGTAFSCCHFSVLSSRPKFFTWNVYFPVLIMNKHQIAKVRSRLKHLKQSDDTFQNVSLNRKPLHVIIFELCHLSLMSSMILFL